LTVQNTPSLDTHAQLLSLSLRTSGHGLQVPRRNSISPQFFKTHSKGLGCSGDDASLKGSLLDRHRRLKYKPTPKTKPKPKDEKIILSEIEEQFKHVDTMICDFKNNYYDYFAYEREIKELKNNE
jgi:hypothetical protein